MSDVLQKKLTKQGFKLGFWLNPLAGIGGPAGQKGSDGDIGVSLLEQQGLLATQGQDWFAVADALRACQRAKRFLSLLAKSAKAGQIELITAPGLMGETLCQQLGLDYRLALDQAFSWPTTPADSQQQAQAILAEQVDLLVFVGGDGTARDLCQVYDGSSACLGVPAGVKMHSGVFAVAPEAAAELVLDMLAARLVNLAWQEVRDIDEAAFRQGSVKSKYFGELQVPSEGRYVQAVKIGGKEDDQLVLDDIAEHLRQALEDKQLYIIGPGSTTEGFMQRLGLDNTLLGVDAIALDEAGEPQLLGLDLDAGQLLALAKNFDGNCHLIVTCIGGQGHVFGRGNQQLGAELIRTVGKSRLHIIASRSKITALENRPLIVDTNDPELDRQLAGFYPVLTGYQDFIYYPLGRLGPQ